LNAKALSFAVLSSLALAAPGFVHADLNDALEGMGPQIMEALHIQEKTGPFLRAETAAVEKELAATVLGELTVSELIPYRDRLNIAAQKDAFTQGMASISFKAPGAAHLKMRDFGSGAAFLGLHIGLVLGQTLGAFLMLPDDIREIDYFHTPYRDILETFGSQNAKDFVPALQVIAVCAVLDLGVRTWASADARKKATEQIKAGNIVFEPKLGLGFLGFGINY
jgi:hypothetical protein